MDTEPSQQALKTRLRKEIRQKRAAIDPARRSGWDMCINQNLENYTREMTPRVVAAYMAFDGEPDLLPALTRLGREGVKLALPVIQDVPGKAIITMKAWSPDMELAANRYGIAEPDGTEDVRIADIDLVLVPLVGWDRTGGRLGMGASFYDRLFQPFAGLEKPLRIGVAYELQRLSSVPRDPWDIRLHGVLTENGWFTCEGTGATMGLRGSKK
jgi:5-formyltetrahydrofolate cyclo-ligase